jgi:HSP20 family protein
MFSFPLSSFLFDDDDYWPSPFDEPRYAERRRAQPRLRDRPAAAASPTTDTNTQQVATRTPQFGWDLSTWTPRCDVKETDREISLIAELPGMKPEDISVQLENGILTVSGERANQFEEGSENDRWHHVERSYGSFSRSMRVPKNVTESDIKAAYDNGVLTVSFPNHAKELRDRTPKRIAVGGFQPRSIESGIAGMSGASTGTSLNKERASATADARQGTAAQ